MQVKFLVCWAYFTSQVYFFTLKPSRISPKIRFLKSARRVTNLWGGQIIADIYMLDTGIVDASKRRTEGYNGKNIYKEITV